jgi:hypothetical protein
MKRIILRSFAVVMLLAATLPAHCEVSPWAGEWIWNAAPREDNYFRATVTAKHNPTQAKVAITADNIYELYINGEKIGEDSDWTKIEVYDVTSHIHKGRNVIAVKATDPGADVGALLVEGALAYDDNTAQVFGTSDTWKISGKEEPGWTSIDFDDPGWLLYVVVDSSLRDYATVHTPTTVPGTTCP